MKAWQNNPFSIDVKEGDTKVFCMCGLSKNGPYCDGSHKTTNISPKMMKFEEDKTLYICGCQQSSNKPYCDGTHTKLNKIDNEDINSSENKKASNMQLPAESVKAKLQWIKVAEIDELQDGDVIAVEVGGKTIALSKINGQFGAIENTCSHQGGPLAEGSLDKEKCLQCPWHGWTFDPMTGKETSGDDSRRSVQSFLVESKSDGIYVQVESVVDTRMTVSDIMAETMVNWGVNYVFGMVGHSNLGLAEALRKQEEKGKLSFIGIRHEGAAAFAASGYAKASGKPAACLAIAGPGATNLLTGLWDAKVDRAPVLALTGQINTQVLGPGAFQEVDLASAFDPVTCWSQTVLNDSDHAELMTLAMKNAIVQRDVSHLIFPDEIQTQFIDENTKVSSPQGRLSSSIITPDQASVEACLDELKIAKQPIIIVGYGARDAMKNIIVLAEKLNCAVLTTFKAKGQIRDSHYLATGVLGRSGTPISASCMEKADLLIVLGASFANHTGINEKKRIIQIDFERMALGKFHPVTVPVWGEIDTTVQLLLNKFPEEIESKDQIAMIAQLKSEWTDEKRRRAGKNNNKGINSAILFEKLSAIVPENAVIAVDVGNNAYSFGRYFECKQQKVLMSGYLGSIGFGYPAAIGAWAACPDKAIFAITGDGGFGQYMAELTTAVKYGMNIKHILLNNSELGKISKEQRAGHWDVWQTSLVNPNFAEYAQSCGALGIRVTDVGELDSALKTAIQHQGPVLVEIITDAELI
jgi:pyruvate oxidase